MTSLREAAPSGTNRCPETGAPEEPTLGSTGSRGVPSQLRSGLLEVGPHVHGEVGELFGEHVQVEVLRCHAAGHRDEDGHRGRDRGSLDDPADAGPSRARDVSVVGVAEPDRLGDLRIHVIDRRWDGTGQRLLHVIVDALRKVFEHWAGGAVEQVESMLQDTTLEGWVIGPTKWPTKWEVDVQCTRRTGSYRLPSHQRQRNGDDAVLLKHSGKRTHGARA